ncbi:unnamed protein product [Paramecium sonneborni]|uniref:Protein kinase domain-containing protein n=1 Tax=Paramecium sonneborni TaxID=65129 RepID=A0A8S1R7J8_9CILI|nr:unnamed protein product [Paramecium sonneborni]
MKSNILSYGYEINIKNYEGEKVYEYIPKKDIAEEFLMCDLFINCLYLRQHTKMINKQKLLFKYDETDKLLSSLCQQQQCNQELLLNIGKQLLEAIWYLHQHNIPGRCFNINNILWNQVSKKITLMEFGLTSPLIILPPELLNKKYRCYGIEIDSFLFGCVLYQLYYKKPLDYQENSLDIQFRNLNMELNDISSPILKELLIGSLQFNLSKRTHFKDLAKLLRCNQDIINFYSSSKRYRYTQNIIDQKIFFREARQNPTYIITGSALMQSLIFSPTLSEDQFKSHDQFKSQDPLRQSIKIKIIESTTMQNVKTLEISKFQCFNTALRILKEFDTSVAPQITLSILALNFGQIYFNMHLRKELEDRNSSYFYSNEKEKEEWEIFRDVTQNVISEDIKQLKNKYDTFLVSYNREGELNQVEYQINNNKQEDHQFLIEQLAKIKLFNYTQSAEKNIKTFLDAYRTQCLYTLSLVDLNLDFTTTVFKYYLLRQSLLLCAFPDLLFKPQLECHKQICEVLNIKMLSKYEQFEESLKSSQSLHLQWFQLTINYLKNHQVGKQYQQNLSQIQ